MYGGFADVEFLCGRADGRLVFEDILPEFHRPLFYGTLHAITPYIRVLYTICGAAGKYAKTGTPQRARIVKGLSVSFISS